MKEKRTGEIAGSIVGNVFAIVIVNTVFLWQKYAHGVILESWVDILWAVNLSCMIQIVGSMVLAFYRPPRFYAFMQMLFSMAGLVSVIVFFVVFPLDFSRIVGPWLNTLLKVVMIIGIGGALIGIIVWLVRFIAGTEYAPSRASSQAGTAAR
jgi:hypothetical protein